MATKAFIFDFDGLIIDTEMPTHQALNEFFNEYGLTFELAEFQSYIGRPPGSFNPIKMVEDRANVKLDFEAESKRIEARTLEIIESQPVLPGVLDYLNFAKDNKIGIALATSSPSWWAVSHLTRLGLIEYFDHLCTFDDVEFGKPDPGLFLLAINRLNVKNSEAIIFEDSANGLIAAHEAGIFAVGIPNQATRGLIEHQADYLLSSLAELPPMQLLEKHAEFTNSK
jgi:putative hydrolase of the HAD superfamily